MMGTKGIYLALLLCMGWGIKALAQEHIRLPVTIRDTTSIHRYITVTDSIAKFDADSAAKRYQEALAVSLPIHFADAIVYCAAKAGSYYLNHEHDYTRGKQFLSRALPYFNQIDKSHYWLIPTTYNLLGNAFFQLGHNDSAIFYYDLALRVMDSLGIGRPHLRTTLYGNMGGVLSASWQYRKGVGYIQKAITSNSGDSSLLARDYGNLGALYANYLNDMDSALYWWSFSIDLYRKLQRKQKLQGVYANIVIGWLIPPHVDIHKAALYLDSAIRIDPENVANNVNIQLGMSSIAYYRGDYKQAIQASLRAIALCDSSGFRERKRGAYSTLSYSYAFLGDTANSHKYQRLQALLSDSLLNENITRSIGQLEVQYRISEKNKKLAEQQAALYRQRYWLAGSIGCGLILLLSLLAIIRNNKQKRRLQAEQMQNWTQQKKIETLRVRAEAEEQERTRIARDLHDGVGVLVSAAMMNYTVLGKKNLSSDVSATGTYKEGLEILQEMKKEIRIIAHNLAPDTAARQNLASAVQTLVKRLEQGSKINITLDLYGKSPAMEPERSLSAYRMIEELMQNIVKHAKATQVLIQLMFHEQQLNITVEDNGIGFDTHAVSGGMGLKNLRSRAQKLNGYLSILSRKGTGTTAEIEIPYVEGSKEKENNNA